MAPVDCQRSARAAPRDRRQRKYRRAAIDQYRQPQDAVSQIAVRARPLSQVCARRAGMARQIDRIGDQGSAAAVRLCRIAASTVTRFPRCQRQALRRPCPLGWRLPPMPRLRRFRDIWPGHMTVQAPQIRDAVALIAGPDTTPNRRQLFDIGTASGHGHDHRSPSTSSREPHRATAAMGVMNPPAARPCRRAAFPAPRYPVADRPMAWRSSGSSATRSSKDSWQTLSRARGEGQLPRRIGRPALPFFSPITRINRAGAAKCSRPPWHSMPPQAHQRPPLCDRPPAVNSDGFSGSRAGWIGQYLRTPGVQHHPSTGRWMIDMTTEVLS